MAPSDAAGPYPALTPAQRELAEKLSAAMVERLNLRFGDVLAEVYEDVRALVELAASRRRGELESREP